MKILGTFNSLLFSKYNWQQKPNLYQLIIIKIIKSKEFFLHLRAIKSWEKNIPMNIEVDDQNRILLNEYNKNVIVGSKTLPDSLSFKKMNRRWSKMRCIVDQQFITVILQSILN